MAGIDMGTKPRTLNSNVCGAPEEILHAVVVLLAKAVLRSAATLCRLHAAAAGAHTLTRTI